MVAIENEEKKQKYVKDVFLKINRNRREDYRKCAKILNEKDVSLVNIQHEYGIFGGDFGEFLLDFLDELQKPSIVTFHSVVPNPPEKMLEVTQKIAKKVKKMVVMTEDSKKVLNEDYKIPTKKITVIPHGIHSFPFESSEKSKQKLKLKKRTVLLTFGLLSPNKGIEYVIDSLPEVVKRFPEILYLVVGATHPNVKAGEGESYRESLEERIKTLKLQKNVKFVNEYQDLSNLILFLKACDVYVATSLDVNQSVSGTFSYALGAGRPVVSTNFAQAREALTSRTGIMVPVRDSKSYKEALLKLVEKDEERQKMGKIAYFETRKMTWQNVSLSYLKIFAKHLKKDQKIKILPPLNVSHILKMTDDFGIFQFANISEPDPESGYTVDDNARAMLALSLYYKKTKDRKILKNIKIHLDFLDFALDKEGFFRNYINKERKFVKEKNSKESPEDPTARALYALARIYSIQKLPESLRQKAWLILQKSLVLKKEFTHSRSIAFFIKALFYLSKKEKDLKIKKEIKRSADVLVERFQKNSSKDWIWFEDFLAYSNGLIPEALALAYKETGEEVFLKTSLKCGNFLLKHSFSKNIFYPIGQQDWFFKGKIKSLFDQQPEEAASIVEMTKILYDITKNKNYQKKMFEAFLWFLGENTLNQFVYDCGTGSCYDGVGEREINLNQGAESTISYLTARLTVEEG